MLAMNAITKEAIEALKQAREKFLEAEATKDTARLSGDEPFLLMADVVFTSAARSLNWAVEDFLRAVEAEESKPSPKCATPGCALTPGHGGAMHFGWAGSFEVQP